MPLLTIRKYLYPEGGPNACKAGGPGARQCARDLVGTVKSALMGSGEAEAEHAGLESIEARLADPCDEVELQAVNAEFRTIMHSFRDLLTAKEAQREQEYLRVFAVLNEAVLFAGSTAERGTAFTSTLEVSLRKASRTWDIRTLHGDLLEMLSLVKEESRQQAGPQSQKLAEIRQETREARNSILRIHEPLGGRADAIAALEHALRCPPSAGFWYSALFIIKPMRAIRGRYGDLIGADLTGDLVKKRILPLAPGGQAFSWTADSVLFVFTSELDTESVTEELAAKVAPPFSYQAGLGTRMAKLSVELTWLISRVEGTLDGVVWPADHFVSGV